MKRFIYLILVVAVLVFIYCRQQGYHKNKVHGAVNPQTSTTLHTATHTDITRDRFLPHSEDQIVHHNTYSVSYNELHEQANWTIHVLNKSDINAKAYDRPYFEIDDKIKTGAASWRNYKDSGFDKGHLVPAGDRKASKEHYDETFLTSNISPQNHHFNAGIWNRLEQKVRYYAQRHGTLYIVTGPVLKKGLKTIGTEQVSVPERFFKLIYRDSKNGPKILAFIIENKASNASIYNYLTTVDDVEAQTGIDFFYQLPDSLETLLEQQSSIAGW